MLLRIAALEPDADRAPLLDFLAGVGGGRARHLRPRLHQPDGGHLHPRRCPLGLSGPVQFQLNAFSGAVPPGLSRLRRLQVLDLSGRVPDLGRRRSNSSTSTAPSPARRPRAQLPAEVPRFRVRRNHPDAVGQGDEIGIGI
jgi:hypothetical protein